MSAVDLQTIGTVERKSIALPMTAWAANLVGIWPVGLAVAYLERDRVTPDVASSYRYLIRTVWIGALYLAVSMALYVVLIGPIVTLAVCLWYVARCVRAMLALHRGEPLRNPRTWLV